MADKKNQTKRQTKAGMMKKNESRSEETQDSTPAGKDSEGIPKISKEKAKDRSGERPVH